MRSLETTHKIMSSIKNKNTKPEIALRKALWTRGFRFRVNYSEIFGKPDIVFTKKKIAIFCDGDFWHGNNWSLRGFDCLESELKTYTPFWVEKIKRNIKRDLKVNIQLQENGWTVVRFWESEINRDLAKCCDIISRIYSES
jgi:DNA mismatch endonuclease (patch repair protein)